MRPWTLLHGVGTGDLFNADSFWSPERKAALTTVYHAWWGSDAATSLAETMRACPAYAHVEHRGLDYPTQLIDGAVLTLRDQAIFHRMNFYGSSFLEAPLACSVPDDLPGRFVYIQNSTPKNGPNCTRFIPDDEWPAVLERLRAWDAVGLVVNIPGGKSGRVPNHSLLVDWTDGRTSMPQSIEILKRAKGYIGIDSCFAILAAQLFRPDRLMIRTNNPWVVERPDAHYPPQTDFGFLKPSLDGPSYRSDRPTQTPGTLVELRCNSLVGSRNLGPGTRVELGFERADELIKLGLAIKLQPDGLEAP